MSILNPEQDAAAIEPLEAKAIAGLQQAGLALIAALKLAAAGILDGLTITITVSKKPLP